MKKILIIDDDTSILRVAGIVLEEEGYEVITASEGNEGYQMAQSHRPDMILSDINMPGRDGCSLLELLRNDLSLGMTQFVLMTGNALHITPRKAMELGADDFLLKPFDSGTLVRCVTARIRRAEIQKRIHDNLLEGLQMTLHSTLPHEFFTPLAGILGMVQLLKDDFEELPVYEVKEMLGLIEESGWRLNSTLKKYISLVELDVGPKMDPSTSPVLDEDQVQSILESQSLQVAKRHHRSNDLVLSLKRASIRCEASGLSLIVEELLDNAFKFSPEDTVVHLRLNEAGVLEIEDHGRGMTAQHLHNLGAFRQFERDRYEQQGLGLGLALVHRHCERCGASLELSSQRNSGLIVRVPFRLADDSVD